MRLNGAGKMISTCWKGRVSSPQWNHGPGISYHKTNPVMLAAEIFRVRLLFPSSKYLSKNLVNFKVLWSAFKDLCAGQGLTLNLEATNTQFGIQTCGFDILVFHFIRIPPIKEHHYRRWRLLDWQLGELTIILFQCSLEKIYRCITEQCYILGDTLTDWDNDR